MIFPQLHDAMQHFAETVIGNLTIPPPFKQVMVYRFHEDGRAEGSGVVVVDSYSALGDVWSNWPPLVEFRNVIDSAKAGERAVRAMLSDAAGTPTDPPDSSAIYCLRSFMADYLSTAWDRRSFAWLPDVFEDLYRTFEESVDRGTSRIMEWCPVHNLRLSDINLPLPILDACELVEPTQTERMDLGDTFNVGLAPSFPAQYFLREQSYFAFGQPTGLAAWDSFVAGAAAIRVAVGGDARPGQISVIVPRGECHAMGLAAGARYGLPDRMFGVPSTLTRDDVDKVQQFAHNWGHLKSEFPLVASRFEGLPTRMMTDDKLVDAMVGLEGLLVPEGSLTELSFRFALRGSWLLGAADPLARREWFERLKAAYDVRSKTLHADAKSLKRLPPERIASAVNASQEALRLLFQQLLKSRISHESWSTRVVEAVFG